MIMVPLPFVTAIFVGLLLLREVLNPSARGGWFIAFLSLLIFQELLIGARFGYGMDWLMRIQPISGAALPPLAYLSFRRPALGWDCLIYAVPVLFVIGVLGVVIPLIDGVLALNNLIFAGLLIRLGLRGSDGLHWLRLGQAGFVMALLWIVVGVLVISGLTDALISYDFMTKSGSNVRRIAGWATLASLVLLPILMWFFWRSSAEPTEDVVVDREVFDAVEALMVRERLFMDPEINLSRVARRMTRPAREVSRAINGATGGNVSQYVNKLRVEAACQMLKDTDKTVTAILYEAGFNTKSNFNREFVRVTGKTPSAWRAEAVG